MHYALCKGITMEALRLHTAIVCKCWVRGHVWHSAQMSITKTNNKGRIDSAGRYMYTSRKKMMMNNKGGQKKLPTFFADTHIPQPGGVGVNDSCCWCAINSLILNTNKITEMVIDFCRSKPPLPQVSINGMDIEVVQSHR